MSAGSAAKTSDWRARTDLFLISVLLLFLELACIRWFPAHVVYLTFFTNTVLLACFLGMAAGCLAAARRWHLVLATPALLALAFAGAYWVAWQSRSPNVFVDVGNQVSPQFVFFGTEYQDRDLARFVLPIEVLGGSFYLLIALAFLGPGQELGRSLDRLPSRVEAYTINIAGSLVGILAFALGSWWELPPLAWFVPIAVGLGYFAWGHVADFAGPARWGLAGLELALLAGMTALSAHPSGQERHHGQVTAEYLWSPYYRVDYHTPNKGILVNLIGHQEMVSRADSPALAYALPHLLNRDSGGAPFGDVLIIGAGSGNDVSRAIQWGARHIDAVEIDPVIFRLGRDHHPDRPYQDERVSVHLDDGRNFLRATDRHYDLIIYALVDSLVLHSSYSNLRLESYLFTREALADVSRCLKPGGRFVMYNYFRQGWIVARLHQALTATFGGEPLVLTLPSQPSIPADARSQGFTVFMSGAIEPISQAFAQNPVYRVRRDQPPGPATPNGFTKPEEPNDEPLVRAQVVPGAEPIPPATDDWPFLYLRRPMLPSLCLRGMAIMGGIGALVLWLLLPPTARPTNGWPMTALMFFLGAGFMLIETMAVVHMALLFGSTWMVNTVVFFAILVMILAANLVVLKFQPRRTGLLFLGLFVALGLNALLPLNSFVGLDRTLQVAGASALVFAPILFAGGIFAVAFAGTCSPDRALGANIAGAIAGGLAENLSMWLGFQKLVLVAMVCYALAGISTRLHKHSELKPKLLP